VYAIQLGDGRELWHTQLAEGTDLQWHSPPTSGDMVIFQSTLSHQGNASGNMAHAIDVHTGEIGWTVDLGGDQGFHFYPTLVSSDQAFLAGPTSV
jgi:outer membrane protein assembly factor BamB